MAGRSPTSKHSYWGNAYAGAAQLPNVTGSPTQSVQVQVGDTAYVTAGAPGLYVCTNATLGAAVWLGPLSTGGGGGGTSGLWVGQELWRWDGATINQFEATAVAHTASFGASTGAGSLSVVAQGGAKLGNALRMTVTGLRGGLVFPVLASELTLPERFVVKFTYANSVVTSGAALNCVVYPDLLPASPAGVQGWGLSRTINNSSMVIRCIADNNLDPQDAVLNGGNWNAATVAKGGLTDVLTCWRQMNDNPTQTRVQSIGERRWDGGPVQADGVLPSALTAAGSFPTPAWNGQDHDRFGIGTWQASNLAPTDGYFEFSEFVIYAHPLD